MSSPINSSPSFQDCLYEEDFEGRAEECCISLDYGTSNPFAAIMWESRGNTWYASNEIYYSGRETGVQKTDDQYLEMLERFIDPIRDYLWSEEYDPWTGKNKRVFHKVPVIVDPSAASFIALLRQSESFYPVSANNDVINGIRETSSCISNNVIKVHKRCKNIIKEFQSYIWDTHSTEDKPVKDFDHLMDSMRYFVRTKRLLKALQSRGYKPLL